jgi:hypothetical protein
MLALPFLDNLAVKLLVFWMFSCAFCGMFKLLMFVK